MQFLQASSTSSAARATWATDATGRCPSSRRHVDAAVRPPTYEPNTSAWCTFMTVDERQDERQEFEIKINKWKLKKKNRRNGRRRRRRYETGAATTTDANATASLPARDCRSAARGRRVFIWPTFSATITAVISRRGTSERRADRDRTREEVLLLRWCLFARHRRVTRVAFPHRRDSSRRPSLLPPSR